MKILIVKLSSIGDIVHTLPAFARLRRALPEAEISWAVERRAAEILRGNSLLKSLIEVDTRALRRTKGLKAKLELARFQYNALTQNSYDVAIDFQGLLKSALLTKISGAKTRIGFAAPELRESLSRIFYTDQIEATGRVNIFEKNLRLAGAVLNSSAVISPDDYEFPIFTTAAHRLEAERVIEQTGANFVILNPGGGWKTKLWDAAKFASLADQIWRRFDLKSVVAYGPNEEDLAQSVIVRSQTNKIVAANLSLKGFYELAKRARVYVGGDTGPTHLAVAANTRVVELLGPTAGWRNGSPRKNDVSIERFDIGCRENCFRRTCNNWVCLDIEVETVLRATEEMLTGNVQTRTNFINQMEQVEIG